MILLRQSVSLELQVVASKHSSHYLHKITLWTSYCWYMLKTVHDVIYISYSVIRNTFLLVCYAGNSLFIYVNCFRIA